MIVLATMVKIYRELIINYPLFSLLYVPGLGRLSRLGAWLRCLAGGASAREQVDQHVLSPTNPSDTLPI
jgi:hypothetical protein